MWQNYKKKNDDKTKQMWPNKKINVTTRPIQLKSCHVGLTKLKKKIVTKLKKNCDQTKKKLWKTQQKKVVTKKKLTKTKFFFDQTQKKIVTKLKEKLWPNKKK